MPTLYVKTGCPWCTEAEEVLQRHRIAYDRVDVRQDPQAFRRMEELSGQTKAPTLEWENGLLLADFGGDELTAFLQKHKLI